MTVKVAGGAGVAVYEMPVSGRVPDDALVALAQEAMRAAAATVTEQVTIGDVCAEFLVPVTADRIRAEAIVMARSADRVRLAADVVVGGRCVASFEADAAIAA